MSHYVTNGTPTFLNRSPSRSSRIFLAQEPPDLQRARPLDGHRRAAPGLAGAGGRRGLRHRLRREHDGEVHGLVVRNWEEKMVGWGKDISHTHTHVYIQDNDVKQSYQQRETE